MKICLRAWQDKEYLDAADEIKVPWEKRDIISEIFEQYPREKIVVLECHQNNLTQEEWEELKILNGLSRGMLKICCTNWTTFANSGIPFYVGYPVYDFYTAEGLARAGVTEIRAGGPLIFDLYKLKKCLSPTNTKIRVVPNVAYVDGLPHSDGVLGGWIRPEDLHYYEDFIDIIEFEDVDSKKREQVLYRIYMQNHEWPGNLQDLITNFNYPGVNRMIPPTLAVMRVNCKQACLSGSGCKVCYRMMTFANPDLYKGIKNENDTNTQSV